MTHSHINQTINNQANTPADDDDKINISEYIDIIRDKKWFIIGVTASAFAIGVVYTMLAKPVYESNLLIQVEDSAGGSAAAQSLLGSASSLFEVKTPSTGEIEVLRSRMVIGRAVDETNFYIRATPNYIPLIGEWLATKSSDLSNPNLPGLKGYVSGKEKITVSKLTLPPQLEGTPITITALEANHYKISTDANNYEKTGEIGKPLTVTSTFGNIDILITELSGKPGASFTVTRDSRTRSIAALQDSLQLQEQGRQSGVIDVTLQDTDVSRLTTILNSIGRQYVRQNVERKAAEAEKSLAFLETQLPQFKKELDASEAAYNVFRNQNGTIALDDEARLALEQTVQLQTRLFEAEQQKRQMIAKFTENHPSVQTLNSQITAWRNEISKLNGRIKSMPQIQQSAVQFQRDIQVNTELYKSLLNNTMQLQLVKEGKTGNVRLLDDAEIPYAPVKPKKSLILALSIAIGLLLGLVIAIVRNLFFRAILNAREIEVETGMNVYATIPLSKTQKTLALQVSQRKPGVHILASAQPSDPAIESLRSLRTALQFAMLDANNNRVLITGPTPGLGKSFVSTNFAAILASGGRRVLLIDADMRKGHINQFFGIRRENGLSELIVGAIPQEQAINRNVTPGLDLITTGVLPPNPAELLMSDAFSKILNDISEKYDIVIIDTAPVLVAADTSAAAKNAGIVLLVARAELTHVGELTESIKKLNQSGSQVTGVLFNGIDTSRRYTGAYGYKYGSYRYASYDYAPQQEK